MTAGDADLARELKRLSRSMTFLSRHPSLEQDNAEGKRLAEIYQQLGMLWEFLSLQCSHWKGWRKVGDGKLACRQCGTIQGVREEWILLPRKGKKTIGRKRFPNSKETFSNKRAAKIIEDAIDFHGAFVNVSVHNSYRSRVLRHSNLDVAIAADRVVRLQEDEIEFWVDTHLAKLTMRRRKRGEHPPYGAFLSELPKRALERFPILIEHDERGELVGVMIFRPVKKRRRKPAPRSTKARGKGSGAGPDRR